MLNVNPFEIWTKKKICADQPILKNWDEILARSLPSVRLDWRIPYATKKMVNPKKGGGSFFCLLSTIHWPLSWPLFSVRCYLVWKTAFISSFSRNRNCRNFFFFCVVIAASQICNWVEWPRARDTFILLTETKILEQKNNRNKNRIEPKTLLIQPYFSKKTI